MMIIKNLGDFLKWAKIAHICQPTFKLNFIPFKPDFTIVIFIHYKPRIAAAILDL